MIEVLERMRINESIKIEINYDNCIDSVYSGCDSGLFTAKIMNAASKYTYKKGFTYEKISPNIEKRITGKSYRKNNNIKLSDLRYVQVLHYGFDGKVKEVS